jgi:hypothetical protein
MSGYLQRLVQTAAQPVQAVHPLTGSIFAPGYENQSSGIEFEESSIADPPTAAADATSKHQNAPERKPRRDITSPQRYRRVTPIRATTPFTSEDARDDLPSSQEQFIQPTRAGAHIEEDDIEQPPTPVFPQTEFHPRMPRQAAPAEPQPAPAPFQAEIRPSRDSRPQAGLARTSDDIQIHIGRIEVTAVHPPAPRANKTPDRGLSLDSYLNRRAR